MNILQNKSRRGWEKIRVGSNFNPKKCKFWYFLPYFFNFYLQICQFWQFIAKKVQILTIFPKKVNLDIFSQKKCNFEKFSTTESAKCGKKNFTIFLPAREKKIFCQAYEKNTSRPMHEAPIHRVSLIGCQIMKINRYCYVMLTLALLLDLTVPSY